MIELRGEPITPGYITMGGFIPAQDEHGWYDTGDLGYITENGHIVVCGRVKDVIIMAGRNIYPTDIERAACRVPGCARAVRWPCASTPGTRGDVRRRGRVQRLRRSGRSASHRASGGPRSCHRGRRAARNVVVLGPGTIPKTPSGKLRRANSVTLVT
ncbi:AMP-binding enzyme family protein [Mycobacterium xenopi 4042]|uniref:AMP-binding enzyme family protein n=1 Tax=Mycobacterium xenopi 4042 TaxID=1299334 RepID=X8AGI1_MYCXE|nr:AMP-binding enzyme family protein [Mycobacterium xenopi 4042]